MQACWGHVFVCLDWVWLKVNGQIFQNLNFNFHLEEICGAPDRPKMSHGGNYSLISFCSTSYVVVKEEKTMQEYKLKLESALLSALPACTGLIFNVNFDVF